MTKLAQAFIDRLPDAEADDLLLTLIPDALKLQLEQLGGIGWHTSAMTHEALYAKLLEHVEAGSFIDIVSFAAMLHVRKELYGDE